MRVYIVRKWPLLLGQKSFCVFEYPTVSLSLLCNVQFVQSIRPRDLAVLNSRIIAAVKNIDAPMLTFVCSKNLNIVSMCAVSRVVHT